MTEAEATTKVRWIAVLAVLMEPVSAKKVRLAAILAALGLLLLLDRPSLIVWWFPLW